MSDEDKIKKVRKNFSLTPQLLMRLEKYMADHYGCSYSEAIHFILMEYFISEDEK